MATINANEPKELRQERKMRPEIAKRCKGLSCDDEPNVQISEGDEDYAIESPQGR